MKTGFKRLFLVLNLVFSVFFSYSVVSVQAIDKGIRYGWYTAPEGLFFLIVEYILCFFICFLFLKFVEKIIFWISAGFNQQNS
jgi:hypothetical protein